MSAEYRRGYEFSLQTKILARRRSKGICENPLGCKRLIDGTVDHKVSVVISKFQGVFRESARSLSNAQCLCRVCNGEKTDLECGFLQMYRQNRRKVERISAMWEQGL